MLIRFKRIVLFFVFSWPIAWPFTSWAWYDDGSYWDYHGSGRDHPYSAYIDDIIMSDLQTILLLKQLI